MHASFFLHPPPQKKKEKTNKKPKTSLLLLLTIYVCLGATNYIEHKNECFSKLSLLLIYFKNMIKYELKIVCWFLTMKYIVLLSF